MRTLLALALLLGASAAHAAEPVTIEGRVTDPRGRPIPCEGVVFADGDLVVSCDDDGRFVLTLSEPPAEGAALTVFAPGYRDRLAPISLGAPMAVTLRRGRSIRSQSTTASGGWLPLDRRAPALDRDLELGDASLDRADQAAIGGGYGDLNRALGRLPGVTGDTAASARLRIRGGEVGDSLVFIDGIRLREPSHLGGLFGAFDSDLASEVRVSTGVPSAALPESIGGAIDARYIDAPRDRYDGAVDLSFLAVGGHLAVALGPGPAPKGSLVVGLRRSLLQAYLGAFQAAGAVDIPLHTVDYGTGLARLSLSPNEAHTLRFTLLELDDRALFDDVNERHRAWGGSFDWAARPSPRTSITSLLAWRWEELAEPPTDIEYPGKREWLDAEHRGRARIELTQGFGAAHALRLGIDGGLVIRRIEGDLLDVGAVPAWAALPNADLVIADVAVDARVDHPELDLFSEVDLTGLGGRVDLRAGLRATLLDATLSPHLSPRLTLSAPFESGTVVRGAVALLHQPPAPRLRRDGAIGVTDLLPERALVALVSVGQELRAGGVVEAMGWLRAMDHLVVPSHAETGAAWTNDGRGLAGGADVSWRWALGRFEAGARYSLLISRRTDPAQTQFERTIPTAGDQNHTAAIDGRVTLGKRRDFVIGLSWTSASGWPSSSLAPVRVDDRWLWTIEGLNDRRMPAVHRVDLRLEHRIPARQVRIRGSFELNADLGGRVFTEDCPSDAPADAAPSCRALTFWPPVRPWLGLKVEW